MRVAGISVQYQTLRSVSDNHVFVICYDGRFDELPDHVRQQGPWQAMQRGEIELPPGARARWLCAGHLRARGVQARGLIARLRPPALNHAQTVTHHIGDQVVH